MAPVSAGTLALWIGTGFALASAVAAFSSRDGESRAWIAGRALAMSAAFTTLAAAILVDALRRHDLTIDFVVRHSTHGVGTATALLAVFADPAGTGLVGASALGIVAAWLARGARAPGIAGTAAVTMVVLLAAPIAGRPLSVLPWNPVDGQDALLFFRQRLSIGYVLALNTATVAATIALGASIDRWRGRVNGAIDLVAARVALVAGAVAAVTRTWASVSAGVSHDTSPLLALGGAWAIAVTAAVASLTILSANRASLQAHVEASLAVVLATTGLALTAPSVSTPTVAVRVLTLLAFAVTLVAAWRARAGFASLGANVRTMRPAVVIGLAASAVALVAGAFDVASGARRMALPSGGNVVLRGGTLDHLGVSRYDDDDSQVLALALELRDGGRTHLASAEHREYADSRGTVLGGLVRIPAVMPGVFTTITWLDSVQARDDVTIDVVDRSPLMWWWVALALCAAAVVAGGLPRRET